MMPLTLTPKQGLPCAGKVGGQTSTGGGLQFVTEIDTVQPPPKQEADVLGAGQPPTGASPEYWHITLPMQNEPC